MQGALALFDRIFEYLDMEPEIQDAPDAARLQPSEVEGRVRFDPNRDEVTRLELIRGGEVALAAGDPSARGELRLEGTIEVEQSLITLESDKATMEIPSTQAGVVSEVCV